jgi:hypothetical protein
MPHLDLGARGRAGDWFFAADNRPRSGDYQTAFGYCNAISQLRKIDSTINPVKFRHLSAPRLSRAVVLGRLKDEARNP